jgi:archaellum component FlaC
MNVKIKTCIIISVSCFLLGVIGCGIGVYKYQEGRLHKVETAYQQLNVELGKLDSELRESEKLNGKLKTELNRSRDTLELITKSVAISKSGIIEINRICKEITDILNKYE